MGEETAKRWKIVLGRGVNKREFYPLTVTYQQAIERAELEIPGFTAISCAPHIVTSSEDFT